MGRDKLAIQVNGRPLIALTFDAVAAALPQLDTVVIVAPPARHDALTELAVAAGIPRPALRLTTGGQRRQDSVRAGLAACPEATLVVVHDAARPLCPARLFADVLTAARVHGAATAALPVVDSLKRVDSGGTVIGSLDRTGLVAVQTPQAFHADLLRRAHESALADAWFADDDCALVERLGAPVVIVAGDPRNLKVTRADDLPFLGVHAHSAPETAADAADAVATTGRIAP